MSRRRAPLLTVLALAVPYMFSGCSTPVGNPRQFDDQILSIASEYKQYSRVSDESNWSPALCQVPVPQGVQQSRSRDPGTHGRKLYFLYAKNRSAYMNFEFLTTRLDGEAETTNWKSAIGQALVKEAFVPVPVMKDQRPVTLAPKHSDLPEDQAVNDQGQLYRTGDPAGLFIMLKTDPKTPGTDEGWIYATTTPDAKTIIEAGRIASCMECHTQTTRDRMYGPKWSWPLDPVLKQKVLPTRENYAKLAEQKKALTTSKPNP
jgi:hypothetical protein